MSKQCDNCFSSDQTVATLCRECAEAGMVPSSELTASENLITALQAQLAESAAAGAKLVEERDEARALKVPASTEEMLQANMAAATARTEAESLRKDLAIANSALDDAKAVAKRWATDEESLRKENERLRVGLEENHPRVAAALAQAIRLDVSFVVRDSLTVALESMLAALKGDPT